jgi:hypothetical protein
VLLRPELPLPDVERMKRDPAGIALAIPAGA